MRTMMMWSSRPSRDADLEHGAAARSLWHRRIPWPTSQTCQFPTAAAHHHHWASVPSLCVRQRPRHKRQQSKLHMLFETDRKILRFWAGQKIGGMTSACSSLRVCGEHHYECAWIFFKKNCSMEVVCAGCKKNIYTYIHAYIHTCIHPNSRNREVVCSLLVQGGVSQECVNENSLI